MLLRVKYRQTSWEEPDIETICLAEFPRKGGAPGFDLTPSVYELDDRTDSTRAVAEHFAAQEMERPMSRMHVDLEGLGPAPTVVTTTAPFAFIRSAHRELRLKSDEELRALVARLREEFPARRVEVTSDAIKDYVGARLRDGDPEWRAFCDTPCGARYWRRFERRA